MLDSPLFTLHAHHRRDGVYVCEAVVCPGRSGGETRPHVWDTGVSLFTQNE